MSSHDLVSADPFADPSVNSSQRDLIDDSTLEVGRNASLTLGTDSLIVLGMLASPDTSIQSNR